MLVVAVLFPLTMIFIGIMFSRSAPKKINAIYGYRTERSMKSIEAWNFSHKYCGRLYLCFGLIMLPVSTVPMFFCMDSETATSIVASVVCIVNMIPMLVAIVLTERALKRNFDNDGNKIT